MANTPSPMLHFLFFELAEQFFGAYSLLRQCPYAIDWAAYFNFCHALEVGLKSFLIFKGMTSKDTKDLFGHHLKKLMDECSRQGMRLTKQRSSVEHRAAVLLVDLDLERDEVRLIRFGIPKSGRL
jgi:hypothetical protein